MHAVGDPHLVNVYGQRFDIFKSGVHVLLQIPRNAAPLATLLHLQARAQQLGAVCDELYFTALNVTGKWADDKLYSQALNLTVDIPKAAAGAHGVPTGGLQFLATSAGKQGYTPWMDFGGVGLKVAWGQTETGIKYLNVLIKHVGHAGFPVGGLLGGDDHAKVSARSRTCSQSLALRALHPEDPHGAESDPHADGTHMAVATW